MAINHRILEGYGRIKFENKWYEGKTRIFLNGILIGFKINDERFSWDIIDHYSIGNLKFLKISVILV